MTDSLRKVRTIAVLSITQIIGWGTTFEMPGALGRIIAADLGLANEVVFGGLTLMLLVGAFLSPPTGRWLQRFGASRVLAAGSGLIGAGLLVLGLAGGMAGHAIGWCIIGAGSALGLSAPAYTAIVEREGAGAKRSIGMMMIFTGLSAAIFWPLLSISEASIGWRHTLIVCAAIHFIVCLPLHLFGLPRPQSEAQQPAGAGDIATGPAAPPPRGTFLLVALFSTLFTIVTFGLSPSLIEILHQSGASPALALQLASLRSVFGITARLGDVLLGKKSTPVHAAIAATSCMIIGFSGLLLLAPTTWALCGFVLLYGIGSGIGTVARAVLPLSFFSPGQFGLLSSRIALPQNIATAFAPVVMAMLLDRGGLTVLLITVIALALCIMTTLWILAATARRT